MGKHAVLLFWNRISMQNLNKNSKINNSDLNMEQKVNYSASTAYRYKKAHRESELAAFVELKKQFEDFLPHEKIRALKKIYNHGICGRNQNNETVIVDRLGNIKIHELSKFFEEDELAHYINQRMLHITERIIKEKEQIIWILDFTGKIMQLASKKMLDVLARIIRNLQTYFPELLQKLVFFNTPMLFDTIWSKVSSGISKNTLDKIVMIGDQFQNLLEFADANCLPDFLGGNLEEEIFLNDNTQISMENHNFEDEQQSSEEEEVDFSALKQALGGLKLGGNALKSVSQTPLNTEADDR